jgi:hypothetical protein
MPDAFIRGIPRAEDRVDEYRHVASYASAAPATSSAHADFRFDFHCPGLTSFHPKQSLFPLSCLCVLEGAPPFTGS